MPYAAEISRANPGCYIFLVDQSGSMKNPIGGQDGEQEGPGTQKAQFVADVLNRLLYELSVRCAKEEGVRDYFQVAVIGYGAVVGSAFGGKLVGRDLVPLSEVADNPARLVERTKKIDDGAGGLVDEKITFPIWVDPVYYGGTPMCQALAYSEKLASGWVQQHSDSFPPIILHLTDGESTDGDPTTIGQRIQSLTTADGAALLFNLHVSSDNSTPVSYPNSDRDLPVLGRTLFGISSILPPHLLKAAEELGYSVDETSRGFAFNADIARVVQFFDIGTHPTGLR